jgi:hypothetical protein
MQKSGTAELMWQLARRHRFLLVGLVTLTMFLAAERLNGFPEAWVAVLRVLIVPMYLVWLVVTMVQVIFLPSGPTSLNGAVWLASLITGLAPYALLDYLMMRWRERSSSDSKES